MKSIRYYFSIPFLPKKTARALKDNVNTRFFWELIGIHLLIILLVFLAQKNDIPKWVRTEEVVMFILGTFTYVVVKLFAMAYIIWITVSKAFKTPMRYREAINILLVCMFLTLLGPTAYALHFEYYGLFYWGGLIYSSILIAYTVTITKEVDFIKMLVLILCCQLAIFLVRAPFMGMQMSLK